MMYENYLCYLHQHQMQFLHFDEENELYAFEQIEENAIILFYKQKYRNKKTIRKISKKKEEEEKKQFSKLENDMMMLFLEIEEIDVEIDEVILETTYYF